MKAAKPMPDFFISKEGVATFWFWVGMSVIVGSALYTFRLATKAGLREQFIIMTPDNAAVELMPPQQPLSAEQHRELHLSQIRLLMDSVFNKSGVGLDSGERYQRLMTAEAVSWVDNNLVNNQKDAFEKGRLHQKVTLQSIDLEPEDVDGVTTARVQGTVIRIGVVNGQVLNEHWKINAGLSWERNPSLRDCARYPSICTAFACTETMTLSVQRDLTKEEVASLQRAAAAEAEAGKVKEEEEGKQKP